MDKFEHDPTDVFISYAITLEMLGCESVLILAKGFQLQTVEKPEPKAAGTSFRC